MKLKPDLARRLERLETTGQDRTPVFVWINSKADACRLMAEAERNNPKSRPCTPKRGERRIPPYSSARKV
jgi:hypothetical protein